eukprot:TRINITY_DN14992_c0_g1_i2.p1 TRINITY_DN14992_c0_g1~~TRINITY_DN14992_c0_g1_i2.p1  ORF type:complete len:295 (-),score=45.34 TRINITY_DN14992_c0_g1_i2:17-901(-)
MPSGMPAMQGHKPLPATVSAVTHVFFWPPLFAAGKERRWLLRNSPPRQPDKQRSQDGSDMQATDASGILRRSVIAAAAALASGGLSGVASRQRARTNSGVPMFVPLAWAEETQAPGQGTKEELPQKQKDFINNLFKPAFEASTVSLEELEWSEILDKYASDKIIAPRAFCNRGNSRARQGRFQEALADYGKSIEIAPYAVNGYLNRGITYESLGKFDAALADYDKALSIDITDSVVWNNRANTLLGLRRWEEASDAAKTALSYSSAKAQPISAVNLNLAEYELGNDNAVQEEEN